MDTPGRLGKILVGMNRALGDSEYFNLLPPRSYHSYNETDSYNETVFSGRWTGVRADFVVPLTVKFVCPPSGNVSIWDAIAPS